MRVANNQSINGPDAAPTRSVNDRAAVRKPTDKVSLAGTKQVDAIVQAARANVGVDRNARRQQLATAIHQGTYRPNAGQLANKIVQAADVDAHLQAILGG